MQDRQRGVGEDPIDEGVALDPVGAAVRAIVEFEGHERAHGCGVAEDKIDVLLADLVPGALPLAARWRVDEIGEAHLGHDVPVIGDRLAQVGEERGLGGREEVGALAIGRRGR